MKSVLSELSQLDYRTISEYLLNKQNYKKRGQRKPDRGNRKDKFPQQGTDVKILLKDKFGVFFFAVPVVYRSSQATKQAHATAVTGATAVTRPDP